MREARADPAEEAPVGVAKLLSDQLKAAFSLSALRHELRSSPEDWSARYGRAFDALLGVQPGGPYLARCDAEGTGSPREGEHYVLTEQGERLIRELLCRKMDELLQHLPRLEEPGRKYAEERPLGREARSGVLELRPVIYHEDVRQFFDCAAQPFWMDYGYRPEAAARMLRDEGCLRDATIAHVRTLLTYCVRGERFCDGFWEGLLEQGKVQAVLHRLQELRDAL
jgi:hypothetical protein